MNWIKCFFLLGWTLVMLMSCDRDGIDFQDVAVDLRLSRDTVLVDTLVSGIRSETYLLKVYNLENRNVYLPKIRLKGGENSAFSINVDGRSGKEFSRVPLRAKDSLMIFVEMAPQTTQPEMLVEDELEIGDGHRATLLGLVQGAELIVSTKAVPRILGDATWGAEKARVIVGDLQIEEGKKLNLQAGARIYFFKGAGLSLRHGAELNAQGTYQKPVILRGHRSDPRQDTLPKSWRGIIAESGAKIRLNQVRLQGAETGISFKDGSEGSVQNTIIRACEAFGIRAENARIRMENLVMNHCGQATLGLFTGGDYTLFHTTLTNYWQFNSLPALGMLIESKKIDNSLGSKPLSVHIENSIIHSAYGDGLRINNIENNYIKYSINGSLIKYSVNAGYVWENNPNIKESIQNMAPEFISPWLRAMNLALSKDSPAHHRGTAYGAIQVPTDIRGKQRFSPPSIGAYNE